MIKPDWPACLYCLRLVIKKSLRVNFLDEGGEGGIVDHGAGKGDFFTAGIKALFESSSVFEKEGESEFLRNEQTF